MSIVTEPAWLTWAVRGVAIWGAITGSLSLLIAFRNHRRDRSHLRVSAEFEESLRLHFPPRVDLGIRIANVGRRPSTLDAVMVRLRARNPRERLIRLLRRRTWVRVDYSFRDTSITPTNWQAALTINEAKTLGLIVSSRELPSGYAMPDVEQVLIRDTSGNNWKSGTKFGQARIRQVLSPEIIKSQDLGPSESVLEGFKIGMRRATLRAYRVLGKVVIESNWGIEGSTKHNRTIYVDAVEAHWKEAWAFLEKVGQEYVAFRAAEPESELRARGISLRHESEEITRAEWSSERVTPPAVRT